MSNNDEKIKKLMRAVEDKKKAMGPRPKVSFETTGLFKFSDGDSFNLNVVGNTNTIMGALAMMLERQARQEEACEMLGLPVPTEMVWNNYKVSDWAGDFKQRLNTLQWSEEKKKLDAMNKTLGKLISEDARTAIELDDIEKMLG